MTLGSLFDGIGVFCLAAQNAGIKPVWASEIEAFPLSVTARHFPDVIQLGDINKIEDAPHVDIITAGSPCTDLSIAGKRSGIHGEKSGLFFKAVELVRRSNAEFFVWENVPHVISRREDFQAVLEAVTQTEIPIPERGFANAGVVDFDGGQLAWRIIDAQYWGVPQRRKRIFLVADFRERRAAKILFEPTSLRGNSAAGTGEEQAVAARTRTNSDFAVYDMTHADEVIRPVRGDKVNCLNARMGMGGNQIQIVALTARSSAFEIAARKNTLEIGVVRRLTPLECERLMGLPDGWTEGGSDAARYKALGNALVLPIAEWILKRIADQDSILQVPHVLDGAV